MKRRAFLGATAAMAGSGLMVPTRAFGDPLPARGPLGSAKEGLSDVGIARGSSMQDAVKHAIALAGGLDFIKPGQTVLIKPNVTGAVKNPTTTNPEVLYAVIKAVNERQPRRILVSDRSFSFLMLSDPEKALTSPKTIDVMKRVGHLDAVEQAKSELKAPVVAVGFEEAAKEWEDLKKPKDTPAWRKIKPENAKHWPNGFELAELLFSVDHVINVPVIKTHFQAWFTMSMKAFVGMSHHRTRREFHAFHTDNDLTDQKRTRKRRRGVKVDPKKEEEEVYPFVARIAELNLGIAPAMNILDGTASFVYGGPSHGDTAAAKVIVASRDRVAADATAVAVLKNLSCEERLMTRSVWDLPFIRHAMKIGIGIDTPAKLNLKSSGVDEIEKIKALMA